MSRSVRAWPIFLLLAVMLVAFFWWNHQASQDIRDVTSRYDQGRIKLAQLQEEEITLQENLKLVGTDAFIEHQARTEYGYMRDDEIRLVITNPEVLYGTDEVPVR